MGEGRGPLLRALVEDIADAEDGLEEDLEAVAASDLWSGSSGEDSKEERTSSTAEKMTVAARWVCFLISSIDSRRAITRR